MFPLALYLFPEIFCLQGWRQNAEKHLLARRGWWVEGKKRKRGREKGKESGKKEGEKKGKEQIQYCLAAASRNNHWYLSELPLNEDWFYQVFALLLYT